MAEGTDGRRDSVTNFLRKYRDLSTGEFQKIRAEQFMDVWNHYDKDGNGYIDGSELDGFLLELVTSGTQTDVGPEAISKTAFDDAKDLFMAAFDENEDGRIDIAELAQLLPMEENFLLLFRRDHPLESSVEFMQIWQQFDTDHSGCIEADELKKFLKYYLKQSKTGIDITEDQLIIYAETILKLFDSNHDGKLQLSEMAKLLPVKENFLCRPVFRGATLTKDDIERVFALYDRDNNGAIENEELHGFLKDLLALIQEDYDAEDIEGCKQALLKTCDVNHEDRINKEMLTMLLLNFNRSHPVKDQVGGDENPE